MEGEPKLRILLLEASLELAPKKLHNHPEIVRTARMHGISPDNIILDKSLHYNALSKLPFKWKRGRPDILHVTLLNILDSPLAEEGRVQIAFHTIEDRLFFVDPATRIPKHYDRFKGLMAQLLREGRVPPDGEPLIWEDKRGLGALSGSPIILLDEKGQPIGLSSLINTALKDNAWLGIGVFPKGRFSPAVRRLARYSVSIYRGRPLKAWTVASRILCYGERIMLGLR